MTPQEAINTIRAIVNGTPPTFTCSDHDGSDQSIILEQLRAVHRGWLEDLIPLLAKLV